MATPTDLTYEIWSDGACAYKPTRAGGYAAVLIARSSDGITAKQWEIVGGEFDTTNNRMELMAVIAGLRAMPALARVCIFIDSTYVMENFRDWLDYWRSNGWRTKGGKEVKNRALWEQLSAEEACRKVKWVQVPGHSGVPLTTAQTNSPALNGTPAERSRRRPAE